MSSISMACLALPSQRRVAMTGLLLYAKNVVSGVAPRSDFAHGAINRPS